MTFGVSVIGGAFFFWPRQTVEYFGIFWYLFIQVYGRTIMNNGYMTKKESKHETHISEIHLSLLNNNSALVEELYFFGGKHFGDLHGYKFFMGSS